MNALRLAATRLAPRVAHNRAAFTSTARLLQSNPCEFLSELFIRIQSYRKNFLVSSADEKFHGTRNGP